MSRPVTHVGPLGQLYVALRDELSERPPGVWVRRRLTKGATVSLMRRPEDRRRLLLISRETAPDTPGGVAAWHREVDTFLRWFGSTQWEATFHLPHGATQPVNAAVWSAFLEPTEQAKMGGAR